MQNVFKGENKRWAKRDDIKSVDKAIALIAERTAVVMSLFCRSGNIDYNDDMREDDRFDGVETKEVNGVECYMNGQPIQADDSEKYSEKGIEEGEYLYPNGEPFTDGCGTNLDDKGDEILDSYNDEPTLKKNLAEIAEFAAKHGVPFSPESSLAIGKHMLGLNDDYWNNSSISC